VTANFAAQGGQKMSHTHMTAPTQFLEAKGIRFAYRRFGKETGVPLVFMQHFRDGLDHRDPAITDGLGRDRPVVLFDNAGVAQRVTTYGEYAISTAVSGIKNIEAQTLNGISVQKIFFQPDVNIDLAVAQITSATNFIRQLMPTGIQAPLVVNYDASSIPVLQLSLDSNDLNEQQLYDYGYYTLRQQLAPVPGVTFPTPDGGKYREIVGRYRSIEASGQRLDADGRGQCRHARPRRLHLEGGPTTGMRLTGSRYAFCQARPYST
jgi:hypothetical protein